MKILLVEDSHAVAALLAARLSALGHEVTHAGNGQLAVEMFRDAAPDLVLMDIEMPVMNGYEATNRIRAFETTQQWAWTPIIFLTASDSTESFVTAIEAGGDDLIVKNEPEPVLQAKMKAMSRIAALRTQLFSANKKLEEMAQRDGLTGLNNRRYMDLLCDKAWHEAMRTKMPFALLMLDVDNFKRYNDCYGHQAGDDCLRAIAGIISTAIDQGNTAGVTQNAFAARYGGEEFAVIMPGASSQAFRQMAATIVESVRLAALPHKANADWNIVTISVGGSRLEAADENLAAMFRTADERLYEAKSKGRNRAELGE